MSTFEWEGPGQLRVCQPSVHRDSFKLASTPLQRAKQPQGTEPVTLTKAWPGTGLVSEILGLDSCTFLLPGSDADTDQRGMYHSSLPLQTGNGNPPPPLFFLVRPGLVCLPG